MFFNVVIELRLGILQTLLYFNSLKIFAEHSSFRFQIYLLILTPIFVTITGLIGRGNIICNSVFSSVNGETISAKRLCKEIR